MRYARQKTKLDLIRFGELPEMLPQRVHGALRCEELYVPAERAQPAEKRRARRHRYVDCGGLARPAPCVGVDIVSIPSQRAHPRHSGGRRLAASTEDADWSAHVLADVPENRALDSPGRLRARVPTTRRPRSTPRDASRRNAADALAGSGWTGPRRHIAQVARGRRTRYVGGGERAVLRPAVLCSGGDMESTARRRAP